MSNYMNQGTITVASTATLIVAANPQRSALHLWNASTQPVYIYKDNTAAVTHMALGVDAHVTYNYDGSQRPTATQYGNEDGFGCYTGAIWGIVASGTANVRFEEV